MVKKFGQFISESKDSDYLLYYAFDWDDNILMMPTKIIMQKKVGDEWIEQPVSTAEFAEVRTDTENWRIDYDVAFIEFRDQGERGDNAFLEDARTAISQQKLGPAWDDFIECLVNGSIFAIITARGHESPSMKKGVEWIIDNVLTESQLFEMYNNLRKFEYFYSIVESERILTGIPSQNQLVQKYLDSCEFVGVSAPSRGGSPANPEKAKEDALLLFKQKVNDYAQRLGKEAKVGFSDDDLKNVKHIEDLVDSLHNEQFPNIVEIVVKGTKDPLNITKKVVRRGEEEITETSHQATGLENSVLTCTQFGNQAGRLNPVSQINRQDDFYNQFIRQTKYLAKTSKDILGDKKKKKSSK
jgi:hypothetical protein